MKLSTQSILLKSLLAIGLTATLAGCASDGYGDGPGVAVGVGVYDGRMHGHHMYTHWDRRFHGNRCRVAYGNCNRFYGGYYYENPWWTMSY